MNYIEEIEKILTEIDPVLLILSEPVLKDEQFRIWPAACTKHHAYYEGLARHTYQVLRFAVDAAKNTGADMRVVALGAVWHDFGKIYDYGVSFNDDDTDITNIVYAPVASQIGHLTLSMCRCREWMMQLRMGHTQHNTLPDWAMDSSWLNKVLHVIVAHHGRKEWGSPREPQTIEALLVHQADMVSVMVDGGLNPQLRNSTDATARKEQYRIEDLTPGDIITADASISNKLVKIEDPVFQARFVRLDKNNCPVATRLSGTGTVGELMKIPLRTILSITPPED